MRSQEIPSRADVQIIEAAQAIRMVRRALARVARRTEFTNAPALRAWAHGRHYAMAQGWEGRHYVIHWVGR